MIQAVIFDIDFTFYDHKSMSVLDSTWEACRLMQKNGIKIALCSGRPISMIYDLKWTREFPFDGYIGSCGAMVYNSKGECIFEKPIPVDKAKAVFDRGKELDINIQTLGEPHFMSKKSDEVVEKLCTAFHLSAPEVKDYEGERVFNINAYGDPDELMKLFHIDGIRTYVTSDYTIDFSETEVTKGTGIQAFMEYYGLEPRACMAFGDSMNDKEMLEYAEIGVAMGNSDPNLFAYADEICGDCSEDSIYETLKKYNVI